MQCTHNISTLPIHIMCTYNVYKFIQYTGETMQDEAPMAHSPPILKDRSLVESSDTAPSQGYTKGTTGALIVPSHTDMLSTLSQSDAVAAVATSAITLAPQPAAVDCPCPGTKAPTTPRINTGITTQIPEDKPGPFPALPSPRMVKLPVMSSPSSHSTSTSGGSLLTKRPPNHNALSYPVPQPSQRQGEKRVRVNESRFESPSKVLIKDAKATTSSLYMSGQSSTVDRHSRPILSPSRGGRTVSLASSASPVAPDYAFTIKPTSTAVNLPSSTLADPCLQFCSPITTSPVLNRNRVPCLYFHSTLGCKDPSCKYDHTKPVIGSTEHKQLMYRLSQLVKKPRCAAIFNNARPQPYLAMGIGFKGGPLQKINYCLPSFTTAGCRSKVACLRCHDLPQTESFELTNLKGALVQEGIMDDDILLPELKRHGLVMPTLPGIESEALTAPVVASVTLNPSLITSNSAVAAVVDRILTELPPSNSSTHIAAVVKPSVHVQEANASDLIITTQDLLYLHATGPEGPLTNVTAAGAPAVTFTRKGKIAPSSSSSSSATTPMLIPTQHTYRGPAPCLHHYSTSKCGNKPCSYSHFMHRIGSNGWYILRDRARHEAIARGCTLQPRPYMGLANGFETVERAAGTPIVSYCLPSFTSLRCQQRPCVFCHDPPLPDSEEWLLLKAKLREYMIDNPTARYSDKARKACLVD